MDQSLLSESATEVVGPRPRTELGHLLFKPLTTYAEARPIMPLFENVYAACYVRHVACVP
jgi:hypothetical protein